MAANLRSLYRLSHTVSASQSTVRNGTYAQIVYSPTGDKIEAMNGQSVTEIIVPLPGGAVVSSSSAGPRLYHHPDHLGSARFVSTSSRTMYYDGAYAPFGEPYAQSGTTDLSFTGMNQDTVAGLYDFPAREYGIQGRWPSPDPAGLAAVDPMNPQSWNRYAYVLNNPIDCVDPSGLCEHMLYDDASCFAGGFFGASNWPTVWEASDSWDWGYYPILWADGGGSPSRPAATPPQSVPPSPQSGSPPWSLSPWQIWGPFGTTIPCDFGACLPIGNPFTGQVGVSVGWTFWGINFNLFAGLAIDLHGHLAIYHGSGQGVATGARASGGVQFEVSNANTVCGLRGPFGNASGTAGLDGLAGTGDVFWGKGDGPGGTVTGGGVTLGVGGGGSASAGRTSTTVSPINGPGCPK